MITKTKLCERTTQRALGGVRWFHLMVLMLVLLTGGSPKAWAADSGLEQAFVGDKQYYVLRSADDWLKFRDLVNDSEGKEVNAIMDADFSIENSIALRDGVYYVGTFNGNGHTLNVNIKGGSSECIAPFAKVKDGATFRDLHVTGSVSAGWAVGGLIGRVLYSSHPTVHIERV